MINAGIAEPGLPSMRFARRLLTIGENRLELLMLEVQEERERILSAVLWVTFTVLGVVAIRNIRIAAHRRWMMRSYAFTFMGLTLLLYAWIGDQLGLALAYKYPAVSWLTFLTNVLFIEIVLWRSPMPTSDSAHRRDSSDQTIHDRSGIPVRA